MPKIIILLAIFVVIVYLYSFRKLKRNREKTQDMNTIQDFRDTYSHLITGQESPKKLSDEYYRKYVTKYNSSEDYREKR